MGLEIKSDQRQLGFYLAGSDRELVSSVQQLMGKRGMVGITDMLGQVHYLIDARQGSPLAMRRILELKDEIAGSNWRKRELKDGALRETIAAIMQTYRFSPKLRGYRYLEAALELAIYERNLGQPFRKVLYPTLADHFQCKPSNIERNLRYLFATAQVVLGAQKVGASGATIEAIEGKLRLLAEGNSQILLIFLRQIEKKLKN